MKEHDWAKLYADADKFMKKVGGTDFNVKTNIKTERWGEALVTVDIPKRNNPIAIMRMDANEYCSRCKGFRRDREKKRRCRTSLYCSERQQHRTKDAEREL